MDEVMAARPTSGYDAEWIDDRAWSPEDFVSNLYYELGGCGRLADR